MGFGVLAPAPQLVTTPPVEEETKVQEYIPELTSGAGKYVYGIAARAYVKALTTLSEPAFAVGCS